VTDAEGLTRFIREAAKIEPDLARWTAAAVWRGLPASRRRRIRDDLLRQAARLLPPVSAWRKAHLLAELARRPGARSGVGTAAGLVAMAGAIYCPERRDREQLSASQAFRILAVSRMSPIEMEAPADVLSMLGISQEREDEQHE
jgi:hypothetical protein